MSSALVVEPPRSRARTGNGPVPHVRLWRPWVQSSSESVERSSSESVERSSSESVGRSRRACPYARATVPGCFSSDGKAQTFQHPVRLFWPKSKSFDFLYSDGEALLRNFPVQATISFYDDSDSDEDDEESEEDEEDECVKPSSRFTALN